MTIWILALLLMACLAAIGHQQGAIRVGISFIGIIVAALLAGLLGKLTVHAVTFVGVKNPILLWVLPPFVAFLIVLSIFKGVAQYVNRKVDVYYRHKAGDLRLALWERLNARLGLCLGLLNGLAYFVLISMVIYPFSYWTIQVASPGTDPARTDPRIVRIFNQMGRDLQRTGATRIARAIDPMPAVFYEAADFVGLIYQNPLLEARLSRYPPFLLSLAEHPQFQALAKDNQFNTARAEVRSIREMLKLPNVRNIVNSPEMLKYIWGIVSPNLNDLMKFLHDGVSAKYTDPLLGRWHFDVNAAMAAFRRANPNITSRKMAEIKNWVSEQYARTTLIAAPGHQMVLKNLPKIKQEAGQQPTTEFQTFKGQWKGENGKYDFSLGPGGKRTAQFEAGRLMVTGENFDLVFAPEDY